MTNPIPTFEQLYAEHQRIQAATQTSARSSLFVVSIIVLCVLTAGFVVAISIARPNADNMPLILVVIGVVVPIITALLAATMQQVHTAVNGRLSQLLELTAKSSRAEGELSGVLAPVPGADDVARAQGKAAGVEQERVRAEAKP